MKKYVGIALMSALLGVGSGCGSSDNGGTGGTGGTGYGGDLCADAGGGGEVEISAQEITRDTVLTADCTYVLTRDVYVVGGSTQTTLTIEPGVTLKGDKTSALIVTTSGKIDAQGTKDNPIVMTSSSGEGDRLTGDWGGVVLLGKAKLSWGNAECDGTLGQCQANIEGLEPTETRGLFGGNDDEWDCGTMKYVRIEFAGYTFGPDNELNGLSVGGCGSQTELDYIQIHRGLDDGVEFFGGTANISHLLVTGTGDDGLDWDQGFRGTATNVIVHHFAGTSSDPRGIEADNFSQNNNVEPRSNPMVQYVTLVRTAGEGVAQQGMVLRRGTWGTVEGAVVVGWDQAGADLRDAGWYQSGGWPTNLLIKDGCFYDNDPDFIEDINCREDLPDNPGSTTGDSDCNDFNEDGGDYTDVANYFPENTNLPAQNNVSEDPGLGDVSGAVDGSGTPDYSVTNGNCMGAFAPDGTDWTQDGNWTAFPAN